MRNFFPHQLHAINFAAKTKEKARRTASDAERTLRFSRDSERQEDAKGEDQTSIGDVSEFTSSLALQRDSPRDLPLFA